MRIFGLDIRKSKSADLQLDAFVASVRKCARLILDKKDLIRDRDKANSEVARLQNCISGLQNRKG